MLLEFSYSKDEYVDGWRKFIFLSKTFNKIDMVIGACSILVPFFLLYYYGFTRIYIALACIIYSLDFVLIVLYINLPVRFFHEFEKYHHPYKLLFEDDTITFDGYGIHSVLTWDAFKHYLESQKYFYMVYQKRSYALIPKRIFSSEEEILTFRQLLASHLTAV